MIIKILKSVKKNNVVGSLFFAVVIIVGAFFLRSVKDQNHVKPTVISKSTLMKAIDISELSVASYKYEGIAQKYKKGSKKKVECYIYYEATVKAGINMKEINIDIDDTNKIVKFELPKIKVELDRIDEKTIDCLPQNNDIELSTLLSICEKDVKKEAQKSTELLKVAQENLKSTIEALSCPLIDLCEYQVQWVNVE